MAKNTIVLKNYLNVFEEFTAAAAITPGHLIELIAAGTVQVHATADGIAIPMFAIENNLEGKGIDDAYIAADKVQVWIPQRGDIVNALLANGETAVIGSKLTSAGDGTLKVYDVAASGAVIEAPVLIVGIARNAVDMSGSSALDPDGRIELMVV